MIERKGNAKGEAKQGRKDETRDKPGRIVQITAETGYDECSGRLTAFGGLLALVKFMDLMGFETLFEKHYKAFVIPVETGIQIKI